MSKVLGHSSMRGIETMRGVVDRKVLQYSKDGSFIAERSSIKKASFGVGVKPPGISRAIKKGICSGGYKRSYGDENSFRKLPLSKKT